MPDPKEEGLKESDAFLGDVGEGTVGKDAGGETEENIRWGMSRLAR